MWDALPRLKGPWNTKALLRLAAAPVLSSVAIALLGAAIGAEPGATPAASSQEKPPAVQSSETGAASARIATPQHKVPVLSRRGAAPRTVQPLGSEPAAGNKADRLPDDVAGDELALEEELPPPDAVPSMIFAKNGEEKSSAHFFDRFAKPIRQFGPKPAEDISDEDVPVTEEEIAIKDGSAGEVPTEEVLEEQTPQGAMPAEEQVVEKSEAAAAISDEAIGPILSRQPAPLTIRRVQPQDDAVAEHLPAQPRPEPRVEPMDEADDEGFAEAPAISQLPQPVLQRAPLTPWARLPESGDALAESPKTSQPLVLPSETPPESAAGEEVAAVAPEAKWEESAPTEPAREPDLLARRAGVSPSMLFQPKRQRDDAAHFFGKNATTEKVFHASKPAQPGMSDLARKHLEGLRSSSSTASPTLAQNRPTTSSTANKLEPQPLQGAALAGTKAGPTTAPGHTALVSKQPKAAPPMTSPAVTAANPAALPSVSVASVETPAAGSPTIAALSPQPTPAEAPSAAPATTASTSLADNDTPPTPAAATGPEAPAAAVANSAASQPAGASPAAPATSAATSQAAPLPNAVASQPAPQPPAVLPWAPLQAEKPVVPSAVPPAPSNQAPPVVVVVQAPGNTNAPLPVAPSGAQTPVYVVVQQSGQGPGAKAAPKPAAALADAQLAQPASAQVAPRAKPAQPAAASPVNPAGQPTAPNASQVAQTAALTTRMQPSEPMAPAGSNAQTPESGQQSGDSNAPPQIGEAPRPRNLEFLRRENILLEPGEYEIDITLQYANDNEDFFFAQLQNNVLQIGEAERVQRLLLVPLELRYGFSPVTQGFVNVPFGWASSEVAFLGQDEYANKFGIGDVSAGLVHQCIEGNEYCPDVLTTVAFSAPTGHASLVNALTVPGSSLGQGFFTATLGFTFIQQYDPVVLFYGFGYQHRFDNEIDGFDVEPGAVYFYRLGLGFAINSRVTVNATFLGSYIERDEINGVPLGGSIREPMQLRLATTISQGNRKECKSRWKIIEPFVNFGLTDDAIDSVCGISWTR